MAELSCYQEHATWHLWAIRMEFLIVYAFGRSYPNMYDKILTKFLYLCLPGDDPSRTVVVHEIHKVYNYCSQCLFDAAAIGNYGNGWRSIWLEHIY